MTYQEIALVSCVDPNFKHVNLPACQHGPETFLPCKGKYIHVDILLLKLCRQVLRVK